MVYVYDGSDTQNETLYTLKHVESMDSGVRQELFSATLSEQPIGRDAKALIGPFA